jgi:hypothetical protein
MTLAIAPESPLHEMLNRKVSPLEEFLGRGEPDSCKRTTETEKIIE